MFIKLKCKELTSPRGSEYKEVWFNKNDIIKFEAYKEDLTLIYIATLGSFIVDMTLEGFVSRLQDINTEAGRIKNTLHFGPTEFK